METYFEGQAKGLYDDAYKIISTCLKGSYKEEKPTVDIPKEFAEAFFRLVDQVNLGLMEDNDNFYGYFLFQMSREIRFDISSPTAVNFRGSNYVIYFNPIIFLTLTIKQMESSIKRIASSKKYLK